MERLPKKPFGGNIYGRARFSFQRSRCLPGLASLTELHPTRKARKPFWIDFIVEFKGRPPMRQPIHGKMEEVPLMDWRHFTHGA